MHFVHGVLMLMHMIIQKGLSILMEWYQGDSVIKKNQIAETTSVQNKGDIKTVEVRGIKENSEGNEKFDYALLQQIENEYTFSFNNDDFTKIAETFGNKFL